MIDRNMQLFTQNVFQESVFRFSSLLRSLIYPVSISSHCLFMAPIFFSMMLSTLSNASEKTQIHHTEDQTFYEGKELDLGQLLRYYGSDKDRNGYTPIYHTLFDHLKNQPLNLLEIGIGTMIPGVKSSMVGYACPGYAPGGSLRAWRDFFMKGSIHGIDVQEDTQFSDFRITTHLCDSTDFHQVRNFMKSLGRDVQFDIIIDDGSHNDWDQLKTLANFYPYLKENGLYIIEDIYPGSQISTNPSAVFSACVGDPFFFVGLKNNICVIYKNGLVRDLETWNY